tara:strand:- start:171 stop:1472 length:1302 start_codon:yes stop_codon:yes gene_type:complete
MEFLKRTPGGAGNRKTFTISTWIKFCNLNLSSGSQNIIESRPGDYFIIALTNINNATGGNTMRIEATSGMNLGIDRFFRDASAWYHLVFAFDTTQATASNRVKFYVNGEQAGLNSTYTTYPNQDQTFTWNNNVVQCVGGSNFSNSEGFDGYLADTYNIDGLQLTPSSFGETDSTTGIWVPKTYSGAYGTNGFRFEYKNSAALGTDTSGQGNNFTPQNMSADNQVVDTPSNNFSIMNPVNIFPNSTPIITEGGLKTESQSTSGAGLCSTLAVSNGKWYAEGKIGSGATLEVGAVDIGTNAFNKGGTSTNSVGYDYGGNIRVNNSNTQTSLSTYTGGDIIGILLNMDTATGTVTFYKNGSAVGSAQNFTTSKPNAAAFYMQSHTSGGNQSVQWNFGNPPFTISSGNADGNGYGNFEYTVPSGYYALCTENLNTYG